MKLQVGATVYRADLDRTRLASRLPEPVNPEEKVESGVELAFCQPKHARPEKPFPGIVLSLFLACSVAFPSRAQDLQLDEGAVGTYQQLKRLQTTARVLHVVAHPDDEDGAMLAYCARGLGARTMLFSITRGEGGANLISSHFFDELGALRTLEHVKAASYYGIDLFYSRAADYGYSKTLDEAMKQWGNGVPILEDLVEVIRRERPTVMLSRFAGDPRDGHGHHQMAGVLSRLAFDAAADSTRFPEQIQRGLLPWQVKKLYVRAGSPWRQPQPGAWTIALPTGKFDPVIGRSFAQVARFGLGFQRSQGISGHDGDPGPRTSYYRLVRVAPADDIPASEDSLFAALDTSLSAHAHASAPKIKSALTQIARELRDALERWSPRDPASTVTQLAQQLSTLRSIHVPEDGRNRAEFINLSRELDWLDERLQRTIETASGIRVDAWASAGANAEIKHAVPGDELTIQIRLANQGPDLAVPLQSAWIETPDERRPIDLGDDLLLPQAVLSKQVTFVVPDVEPTRPDWQRSSIAEPTYQVGASSKQRAMPSPPFRVSLDCTIESAEIQITVPIETRFRHPEYGQVEYPLTVVPAMSVRFRGARGIAVRGHSAYSLPVVVESSKKGRAQATVSLRLPDGWTSDPVRQELAFQREGEQAMVEFQVEIPEDAKQEEYRISAVVDSDGQAVDFGFETVSAPDLGRMNIYHDAVHELSVADVQLLSRPKVAYIDGSGDKVAEALAPLGITPTHLAASELASGDLSQYDVILVGVRAYAVREDIRTHNARLLAYVRQGGVLIVQYQTPEFDHNFGPYPYEMGRRPEEVSEEDSNVTLLVADHPILNIPNKISSADFDGWFEQRGSKFLSTWDERYVPLLECHDAGQSPQQGGMLVAKYGKGVYVYSAYAWYRQLPNGVPGAYRIFANLLSLPKSGLVE